MCLLYIFDKPFPVREQAGGDTACGSRAFFKGDSQMRVQLYGEVADTPFLFCWVSLKLQFRVFMGTKTLLAKYVKALQWELNASWLYVIL